MKIPASKLIKLSILRLLRIVLEEAICFLSYLLGLTRGCEVRMESPGHKDRLTRDNNQIRPPFR